jgi:cytochrome b
VIYLLVVLGLLTGIAGYATYNDIGGEWMEDLHEGTANVMLTLVFIHVAGVLVSSVLHRENLVKAMVTGYKWRRRDSAAGEQWAPRGHGD